MTTDSGMSSPFPNELVDIVIRQLAAEEDSKFLSAAALVNRNTASIVRKLRFSVLALGPHRGEERCARLWDLIQTNPTLVHNVESLTLIDDSSEADEVNAPSCGWVTTDSTYTKLGDVLKALAGNLTTLEVQSSCLQWHYVEEDVQEALFDLFAAPTLTTLRLVGILGMEITPILDCSNLKRLSLKRVTIIENEEDLEAEEETRPDGEVGQLEVLEVVESDEWAFYFLVSSLLRADAKLSLRNLQRLVIAMENPRKSSPNTTVLDKALDQLAGIPLNSLRVEHASHPSFQIDQRTCVFTRWPNLRSLEIAVKPLNGVESWISPVSQALHRMRALEDLTLEVDHSDLRPHATQRIGVWQELESVLMLRDSFRRLVVIINMDKSLQEHAAMEDTLKSCMSSLFKDGKVQVIVKWRHVQMKTSRAV
ncbi:hypothetical protein CC1G_07299 [Coprinopsis cinerea okayama7|uniref:F-box domain-containing protein n=1 Tax=Coprinopsis cinerea (strain Okayama-7 / 130 / ATCC MYA-4618 / FGSC 9003) TaxID=240176 RepID=A8NNM9_COPC7|nr:hypothetical protein CC1G_07299 [Coprinopsis cinerea okayama7\|eukprot:XP_001835157.2 hypothetical protein CC1G_07299 [Coprinopsis cinerea okayama7\